MIILCLFWSVLNYYICLVIRSVQRKMVYNGYGYKIINEIFFILYLFWCLLFKIKLLRLKRSR